MVRYKIQFTVSSELLFKHISQFIPVDDLHIEEMVDLPPQPMPESAFAAAAMAKKIKAKYAAKHATKRLGRLDTTTGMNAVIIHAMSDGNPHKTEELIKALVANEYNRSSINSQLAKMRKHGLIIHETPGYWRLKNATQIAQEASRDASRINGSDLSAEETAKLDG